MSSDYATDSTSDVTTHSATEVWRVQLATGEVRAMSLDALDAAFHAGVISERSPVLPPGATAWTSLADAAGLDAPSHESDVPSVAPIALSVAGATADATAYGADLDLDGLDDEAFKPKRGRMFAVVGIAALVLGGLGFAASRMGNVAAVAQSSLSAQKAAAAAPPPAAVDLNEAAPVKTLTEEQKAKLAEADKAREAASAARDAQRRKDRPSPPAKRGPHEKTTTPFVNGGSKYDPLNGAL